MVLLFGGHEVPCEPYKAPISLDIGADSGVRKLVNFNLAIFGTFLVR